MTKEGIQARSAIIENVAGIENENVLRSIALIMGDYVVSEDGTERANYITPIIFRIVAKADLNTLEHIFLFVDAICKE